LGFLWYVETGPRVSGRAANQSRALVVLFQLCFKQSMFGYLESEWLNLFVASWCWGKTQQADCNTIVRVEKSDFETGRKFSGRIKGVRTH